MAAKAWVGGARIQLTPCMPRVILVAMRGTSAPRSHQEGERP